MCVTKLWVTKLCVREMCVKKLCAKELCLTKLCAIKSHMRKRCDRLCVPKLRVTKSYLREMDSLAAWMSPSATPAMPNEGRCRQVPHLPHKVEVDVAKCLPRKVPWRHGRLTAPKRATRVRASPVPQAPHMPRKMKVDVAKCHTCHAKESSCKQEPRLPRKWNVNVTKCHACHAKWRGAPGDQRRPTATKRATKCNKCYT